MALGPIDMSGGMPPQAHSGGQLSAELLDARIERLLQILNRADLTPSQRENTLRALTALQRERTLLQAFSQSDPASAPKIPDGRDTAMPTGRPGQGSTPMAGGQSPAQWVKLGDQGRMLSEMANVERALEVNEGTETLLSSLGTSAQQAESLCAPLESQVIAAGQIVVQQEKVPDDPLPVSSVLNPPPVLGFIPAQWIPDSVRAQARSPATLLLVGIVVLLTVIVLIW